MQTQARMQEDTAVRERLMNRVSSSIKLKNVCIYKCTIWKSLHAEIERLCVLFPPFFFLLVQRKNICEMILCWLCRWTWRLGDRFRGSWKQLEQDLG